MVEIADTSCLGDHQMALGVRNHLNVPVDLFSIIFQFQLINLILINIMNVFKLYKYCFIENIKRHQVEMTMSNIITGKSFGTVKPHGKGKVKRREL